MRRHSRGVSAVLHFASVWGRCWRQEHTWPHRPTAGRTSIGLGHQSGRCPCRSSVRRLAWRPPNSVCASAIGRHGLNFGKFRMTECRHWVFRWCARHAALPNSLSSTTNSVVPKIASMGLESSRRLGFVAAVSDTAPCGSPDSPQWPQARPRPPPCHHLHRLRGQCRSASRRF
jgi:hypothetical protein